MSLARVPASMGNMMICCAGSLAPCTHHDMWRMEMWTRYAWNNGGANQEGEHPQWQMDSMVGKTRYARCKAMGAEGTARDNRGEGHKEQEQESKREQSITFSNIRSVASVQESQRLRPCEQMPRCGMETTCGVMLFSQRPVGPLPPRLVAPCPRERMAPMPRIGAPRYVCIHELHVCSIHL